MREDRYERSSPTARFASIHFWLGNVKRGLWQRGFAGDFDFRFCSFKKIRKENWCLQNRFLDFRAIQKKRLFFREDAASWINLFVLYLQHFVLFVCLLEYFTDRSKLVSCLRCKISTFSKLFVYWTRQSLALAALEDKMRLTWIATGVLRNQETVVPVGRLQRYLIFIFQIWSLKKQFGCT